MTILVTGFEPFGQDPINPTQELVRHWQVNPPAGVEVVAAVLPVDTETAPVRLLELLTCHRPDAILMFGLAAGRASLSVERVALNWLDFRIPDNAGRQMQDRPIVAGAPAAYFATLPVRACVEALLAAGIPAEISYTAGTYLCNQAFYLALHWAVSQNPIPPVGFVHVPPLPAQLAAQGKIAPSMTLDLLFQGAETILALLAKTMQR